MFFQYSIKVNPIKNNRGSHANGREQGTEMLIEGSPLDSQVMQGLLAIESAFIHCFPSGRSALRLQSPSPVPAAPGQDR